MLRERSSVDLNASGFGRRNESEQFNCQVAVSEGEPSIEFAEIGNDCNGSCVRLRCYPSVMPEEQARLILHERKARIAEASAAGDLWP
jgi:hypothetical protein